MKNDSEELDLGIVKEPGSVMCCEHDKKELKPSYPELCFSGAHADLFREKYGNCAPGDEYTMTVRCRVRSASDGDGEYQKRVEMCVEAIVGDVIEEEAGDEKEEKPKTKLAARRISKAQSSDTAESEY